MRALFVACGALFGFLLSRARGTDYEAIVGMFQLTDLHLLGVMGVGIASAALGLQLLRRKQVKVLTGDQRLRVQPKPMRPWIFAAGLVFGAGWGLTGACPGTALSQVGEGKLYALFTVSGLLAGTWVYGLTHPVQAAAAAADAPTPVLTGPGSR